MKTFLALLCLPALCISLDAKCATSATEPQSHPGEIPPDTLFLVRQEALPRRATGEAKPPHAGEITSGTRDDRLAQYGEDWRIKVEKVGTENFPHDENGSLYGSIQVIVLLLPDGSVKNAVISRRPSDPRLAEAALHIITQASPFAPFPAKIRETYDQLYIERTLHFVRGDNVEVTPPARTISR